eukprot:Nk52_evm8s1073 gene=Nk52_evmTU8s1073
MKKQLHVGPSKGPKIKIKPFKQSVSMDPAYVENTWELLRQAIVQIQKQDAGCLSFEELYRNAYNLVLHKHGDRLYQGLREVVKQHLQEVCSKIMANFNTNFLVTVNREWESHGASMIMIRDILMYMNRVYVKKANVATVEDLGLQLFLDLVVRSPKIKEQLVATLLNEIHKERCGEVIERGEIKKACYMLLRLGINSRRVYEEEFENALVQESEAFYRLESQKYIGACDSSEFLKRVESRLKQEADRVAMYLDQGTEPKLTAVVRAELLTNNLNAIVFMEGSGLVHMLDNEKMEDLRRMYVLCSGVPGGADVVCDLFQEHLKGLGKAIVMQEEQQCTGDDKGKQQMSKAPIKLVESLIALRKKYSGYLKGAFDSNPKFQNAFNSAFEHFINLDSKSSEYLSLFIDEKLKKSSRGSTEEELEAVLDESLLLFRYMQEKDIFEKYYKNHLARRLLQGKSVSVDAERSMISKLKSECGYQFTCKLEGMFKDMGLSSDCMEKYKKRLRDGKDSGRGNSSIELNVKILTTGHWPLGSNSAKCLIPKELSHLCKDFENFYLGCHSGRRLSWLFNMGSAEVKCKFGDKKHELSVPTYQMMILLLFNNTCKTDISFKDIMEETMIPEGDLKRSLQSLACAKYKVLTKTPKSRDVNETDTFKVNEGFESKLYRIKIQSISAKETEPERQGTRSKVDDDRKYQIEACIVRIMKSRKKMEHSNLVAETTRQLSHRFPPNPLVIKKRIEILIEREYLERSMEDRRVYNYLA